MIKRASIVVLVLLFAVICHQARAQDTVVYTAESAPYVDPLEVPKKIQEECTLPEAVPNWIVQFADKAKGITVVKDNAAVEAGEGRILIVEIRSGISSGNAWTGHLKQLAVQGRLLQDGEEIGNFVGIRSSRGGFGAGFKGSCNILNRCAKALGRDIVGWLSNPGKDARIGE